jgi:transposase-like protein
MAPPRRDLPDRGSQKLKRCPSCGEFAATEETGGFGRTPIKKVCANCGYQYPNETPKA